MNEEDEKQKDDASKMACDDVAHDVLMSSLSTQLVPAPPSRGHRRSWQPPVINRLIRECRASPYSVFRMVARLKKKHPNRIKEEENGRITSLWLRPITSSLAVFTRYFTTIIKLGINADASF